MFGASVAELSSAFERDGFVIARNVVSAERCADMVAEIWRHMPARFAPGDPRTWSGRIQDCCNNLPLYQRNGLLRYKDRFGFRENPVFERHIYSNARMGELFESATGRPLGRLHIRGLHPIMPMPRWVSVNEALGNRLDPQMEGPERFPVKIPRPPLVPIPGHLDAHSVDVMMMVYLDDVPANGGGLSVWRGSHHLLRDCFDSLYDFLPTPAYRPSMKFLQRFESVQLAGSKGDVVVFDNRLLHSNSVNHSDRIRQAVLIDCFGEEWKQRDCLWKEDESARSRRETLAQTGIATSPAAKRLAKELRRDRVRAFWWDHPRLRAWVSEIAKDPVGKARRRLSSKIRMRREGDCWIVVSQGSEHKASFKLDAYGYGSVGKYRMSVNGGASANSMSGSLVERIELRDGPNCIDISGQFGVDHYVRVIRSKNPLHRSDILYSGVIAAKRGEGVHRIDLMQVDRADAPSL